MGFFSRFRKEKPKNALSTSHSFFWGGSTAGVFVSESTALQTAAVYACVRLISEAVAGLPLSIFTHDADGGAVPQTDHHLYTLLHYAPNPEMTSFVFRETLMGHLLLYGNAYAQILRDGGGRVVAMYPLLPNKIDVSRNDNGEIFYTYWRDSDETHGKEKSGGVILRKDDVLHIPALSFDGMIGYSPIAPVCIINLAVVVTAHVHFIGQKRVHSDHSPTAVTQNLRVSVAV